MSNKEKEKVDQQSEMNLSRRSVLSTGAALAGAGIIGSQLIDPAAKQLMLQVATNRSGLGFRLTVQVLEHFTAGGTNVLQMRQQNT